MLSSYLVGVLGLAVVAAGWVAVQRAWAGAFPDAFPDPDVLAGRRACNGCGCTTICQKAAEEESR